MSGSPFRTYQEWPGLPYPYLFFMSGSGFNDGAYERVRLWCEDQIGPKGNLWTSGPLGDVHLKLPEHAVLFKVVWL